MFAVREDKDGRLVISDHTVVLQRISVLGDLHLLCQDVLFYQRGTRRCGGTHQVRYDGGQEDGSTRVHRFRVLGSDRLLRRHRTGRLSADRCLQNENIVSFLLSPEFLRQPVPLRSADATIQKGFVRIVK